MSTRYKPNPLGPLFSRTSTRYKPNPLGPLFSTPMPRRPRTASALEFGDLPGHPFRGNQYHDGESEVPDLGYSKAYNELSHEISTWAKQFPVETTNYRAMSQVDLDRVQRTGVLNSGFNNGTEVWTLMSPKFIPTYLNQGEVVAAIRVEKGEQIKGGGPGAVAIKPVPADRIIGVFDPKGKALIPAVSVRVPWDLALEEMYEFGESAGHPFRGNQWTEGADGSSGKGPFSEGELPPGLRGHVTHGTPHEVKEGSLGDPKMGTPAEGPYYHGTSLVRSPGDLIEPSIVHGNVATPSDRRSYLTSTDTYLTNRSFQAGKFAATAAGNTGGNLHVYEVHPVGSVIPDSEFLDTGFGSDQVTAPLAQVVREVPIEEYGAKNRLSTWADLATSHAVPASAQEFGEGPGHPFRGNQWTDGESGSDEPRTVTGNSRDEITAALGLDQWGGQNVRDHWEDEHGNTIDHPGWQHKEGEVKVEYKVEQKTFDKVLPHRIEERTGWRKFSEKIDHGPIQYVGRVVSEADYQRMKAQGELSTDGRGNIDSAEGLVTEPEGVAWTYLGDISGFKGTDNPTGTGRALKIRVSEEEGWYQDTDGYVKNPNPVPFDRVEAVSEPIGVSRTVKYWDREKNEDVTWESASGTPAPTDDQMGSSSTNVKYKWPNGNVTSSALEFGDAPGHPFRGNQHVPGPQPGEERSPEQILKDVQRIMSSPKMHWEDITFLAAEAKRSTIPEVRKIGEELWDAHMGITSSVQELGEGVGHPFRGNQWTEGEGGGSAEDRISAAGVKNIKLDRLNDTARVHVADAVEALARDHPDAAKRLTTITTDPPKAKWDTTPGYYEGGVVHYNPAIINYLSEHGRQGDQLGPKAEAVDVGDERATIEHELGHVIFDRAFKLGVLHGSSYTDTMDQMTSRTTNAALRTVSKYAAEGASAARSNGQWSAELNEGFAEFYAAKRLGLDDGKIGGKLRPMLEEILGSA